MVSFISDTVYHIQEIKHLQQFKFTVKNVGYQLKNVQRQIVFKILQGDTKTCKLRSSYKYCT